MRETTPRRTAAAILVGATALAVPVAPAGPASGQGPPPPISVMVETSGTTAPAYRIAVRNDTDQPVTATVRQELPGPTAPTSISEGGDVRPAVPGHGAGPAEVTWQVRLPARGMKMLSSALPAPPAGTTVTAPACAFSDTGVQAYDCAAASWVAPGAPAISRVRWWQREAILVPAAAVLLLGLAIALFLRRARTRQPQDRAERGRPGGATAAVPSRAAASPHAALAWPPSPPRWGVRRAKPATALVVGVAVALLSVTLALTGWTGGTTVTAMRPESLPTSGAWLGRTATGSLGDTLREAAFEFTVYRVSCDPAGTAATRTCLATVALHNASGSDQLWHGGMQRIYLPNGTWVSADEAGTRAANGGTDLFAKPVPAGDRRLIAVAFTVPTNQLPVRIELRSGAFSAGVSVPM